MRRCMYKQGIFVNFIISFVYSYLHSYKIRLFPALNKSNVSLIDDLHTPYRTALIVENIQQNQGF